MSVDALVGEQTMNNNNNNKNNNNNSNNNNNNNNMLNPTPECQDLHMLHFMDSMLCCQKIPLTVRYVLIEMVDKQRRDGFNLCLKQYDVVDYYIRDKLWNNMKAEMHRFNVKCLTLTANFYTNNNNSIEDHTTTTTIVNVRKDDIITQELANQNLTLTNYLSNPSNNYETIPSISPKDKYSPISTDAISHHVENADESNKIYETEKKTHDEISSNSNSKKKKSIK